MEIGEKIKNYCGNCCRFTNHNVSALERVNTHIDYDACFFYCIIKCMGCDGVSYRTEYVDFESMEYDEYGEFVASTTTEIFPFHIQGYKHASLKVNLLPKEIREIYKEALIAFASKCYILTAIAFRSTIEAICIDKKINGDLEAKIEKMVSNQLITINEGNRLHSIRFMGNDSVHKISKPTLSQLNVVLSVVDNLLTNLYLIDIEAEKSLVTVIDSIKKLLRAINEAISKLEIGQILSLRQILGIEERLLPKDSNFLDEELKQYILDGKYKQLALGEVKLSKSKIPIQYYHIVDNDFDFNYFF